MRGLQEVVVTRAPNARSKQGTLGMKFRLQTNYFRLERKEQPVIFQHHVDFLPPVEDVRLRQAMFQTQRPVVGPYIFDGMQLFLYNKLSSDEVELQVKNPYSVEPCKMRIRRVGTVTMTSEKALQMLNLMQRQAMASLKLIQLNRNFFDPAEKISVPKYNLELYPGYITSIRQHEHDILLGVQITHRVLSTETVYNKYRKMLSMAGGKACHDEFKKTMIGTVVMTMYNNKTYTIADVDFSTTPSSSFKLANGDLITFKLYFYSTYNVKIVDELQPMLVTVPQKGRKHAEKTEPRMLVPELCRLTGISEEMRKDHQLMCAIANHTRLTVDQRIKRLERFNARLLNDLESHQVFSYWKTELDRRLMDVPARVLAQENLYFGRRDLAVPAGPNADWSAACRSSGMFKTEKLLNWCAICPDTDAAEGYLHEFIQHLTTVARGLGFTIAQPMVARASNTVSAYLDKLRSLVNRDPQLILCVVPDDRADRYRMIKKLCCIDRAIPTQVLRVRTIMPNVKYVHHVRSVATKVAIQLNCKLGGIPWMVKNPLSSLIVIGYDVCHDTSMADRSYGALVATMYGERATPEPRFFSCVEPHAGGIELSSFISTGIAKAIRAYQNVFGSDQLPRRIFFYRDGVGDGQLEHVVKHEVNAIRERLQIGAPDRLRLTFFVVTKRIGTRLFHNGNNPPPGTIVDDQITLPERTDFYLVSQSVRHGTVSPTSYNIIHDESGLTVDQLQAYTAKQTHLYYNWTGAVSVPAVCQYAHKLAGLVGQYLHQAPNERLDRHLYFL
uniref:Uncharacterized protein n=1 Tax=Anopheles atroparvus TaxID=41427 RepID=A0A182IW30_ANOAO